MWAMPSTPAPAARHAATEPVPASAEHPVDHPPTEHGPVDRTSTEHAPVEHERPEDWGWHADLGRLARIAGWISVLVVLSGLTVPHYNNAGTAAILITAGLMVLALLWDARKRRTSWRR